MKNPSNYERLQQNQEEIGQKIAAYINTPLKDIPKPKEIEFDLQSPNYSKLIEQLEENRDAGEGIKWTRNTLEDGSKVLIRDARNVNPAAPPPLDSPESYKIQFLNAARAAEEILNLELGKATSHEIQDIKDKVRITVKNFLDNNLGKDDIKKENTTLVGILKAAGIENAGKKISVAKDFGNLSDQHYHVTTITKQKDSQGKDSLVVESDAMLLGLTENQKLQYLAIKHAKRGENIELTIKGEQVNMDWYNNLAPHLKDLVHKHAGEIAEGNFVLPTQLRGELIGVRNAHSKTTYITPPLDELQTSTEPLVMKSRTLHAGTASFHGKQVSKEERQEIATENLRQLQSFVPQGRTTTINVLNSPANPTGIDSAIHEQVGKGQEKLKGNRATTPFNIWRLVSRNDNTGFEKILSDVGIISNSIGLLDIAKFLTTGKNEQAAREQLVRQKVEGYEPEALEALEHAINAKHLTTTSHLFRDPNNSNLALSTEMNAVAFSLLHGALNKPADLNKIPLSEVVVQCASGKDRTGLELTDQSFKATNEALQLKGKQGQQIENLKTQVKGGHTQFMASANGGTRGAHGIKKDTLAAFPQDPYKDNIEGLQQNTASHNKFKYEDREKQPLVTKIINKILDAVTKPFKTNKDEEITSPATEKPSIAKFSDISLKKFEEEKSKMKEDIKPQTHGEHPRPKWAEGVIERREQKSTVQSQPQRG
ncbi:hypothetical protein [Candidatus Jidaibacter acanthamoebae]|nr:hypothetical protein [Candidatus Jidaibacter acanthamoeba]